MKWDKTLEKQWNSHTKIAKEFSYRHLLVKPVLSQFLKDYRERKFSKQKKINVLDFGCGNGFFTLEVLEEIFNNDEITIHGIDILDGLLKDFQKRASSFENSTTKLDLSKKIFSSTELEKKLGDDFKKFDLIISIFTIHNVKNFTNVFENLKKILKVTGEFFFVVVHPDFAIWLEANNQLIRDRKLSNPIGQKDYSFAGDYPIVEPQTKEVFYVPYFHRSVVQWQTIFKNCSREFVGLKPTTSNQLEHFKTAFNDSIYHRGIYDHYSGLCIMGKLLPDTSFADYDGKKFLDYFESKYENEIEVKSFDHNYLYNHFKKKFTSLNHEMERIFPLNELSDLIGNYIFIVKSGLWASGKIYTKEKGSKYFLPEFIFEPGDILGDFEASFSKSNDKLLKLKKIPGSVNVGYSSDLRAEMNSLYSKSLLETPMKQIIRDISDEQIHDYGDLKEKICEKFTDWTKFSDELTIFKLSSDEFYSILLEDDIVKKWYSLQNIKKTKRVPLSYNDIFRALDSNLDNYSRALNEVRLLFALIINYCYFQEIGKEQNNFIKLRLLFTHRVNYLLKQSQYSQKNLHTKFFIKKDDEYERIFVKEENYREKKNRTNSKFSLNNERQKLINTLLEQNGVKIKLVGRRDIILSVEVDKGKFDLQTIYDKLVKSNISFLD